MQAFVILNDKEFSRDMPKIINTRDLKTAHPLQFSFDAMHFAYYSSYIINSFNAAIQLQTVV